jgi:hypothetical protein
VLLKHSNIYTHAGQKRSQHHARRSAADDTTSHRVSIDWFRPMSALMPSHYAGRECRGGGDVWCGCGFESGQHGLPEAFQSMVKVADLQKVARRVWSRIRKNRMDRTRARIGNVEPTKSVARQRLGGLCDQLAGRPSSAHSSSAHRGLTAVRAPFANSESDERGRHGRNLRAAPCGCKTGSERSRRDVLVSKHAMLSRLRA